MLVDFAALLSLVLPAGSPPGTARIVIGSDIPSPLDTYQFETPLASGLFLKADAALIFYEGTPSDDDYNFIVHATDSLPSRSMIIIGSVLNGAVNQIGPNHAQGLYCSFSGATNDGELGLFGALVVGNQNVLGVGGLVSQIDLENAGLNLNHALNEITSSPVVAGPNDFVIDQVSQPRGLRANNEATSNTAAIGAEAVIDTVTWFAFAGRAYSLESHCGSFVPSAATTVGWRWRKTNLAGAFLTQRFWTVSGQQPVDVSDIVVHTGASGFVTAVVTLQATGGPTVVAQGAGSFVRRNRVLDAGAATDYPNAPVI